MKKALCGFVLLLFTTFRGISQEIRKNEVDGFTQQRTIETSVVSLRSAYTRGMGLYFSFVGTHYLVNVVGYGEGIGPIRQTDFLYFLMEDGLILIASSIGDQPDSETKVYQHHYLLRFKDFNDLRSKSSALLRLSTPAGNMDITISKRSAKEIKKLAAVFVKEVMKQAEISTPKRSLETPNP